MSTEDPDCILRRIYAEAALSAERRTREAAEKEWDCDPDACKAHIDAFMRRAEAAEKASAKYQQYAAEKSNQYVAALARLKPFVKISADIPDENFWPTDVFLAIRAAAEFMKGAK